MDKDRFTTAPSNIMDDDDDDICPVCDGQCTCLPAAPLNIPQITPAPLKIKLTVPQSILAKRRLPQNSALDLPCTAPSHPPKRRGRPPKTAVAVRHPQPRPPVASTSSHSLPANKKSSTRLPLKQKKKPAPPPRNRKRRPPAGHSDLSDLDSVRRLPHYLPGDQDAHSDQFPTFVSASALSSRASSSSASDDPSDLSTFDDSDSSIEAEEENFIRSEMSDRSRVRRHILGDDVPKKRDPHNAWIIRPRKNSDGPSDVNMDVDTDATMDDDEEDEDEEPDDGDDEETDGHAVGAGYVGLATGWSDDDDEEESSFDADLFFANLSSSEHEHEDSSSVSDGDGGDHSDISSSINPSIISAHQPHIQDKLAFEVTESWDGQIIFTNGLKEGQGTLDMDFEAHAAQYRETSPSSSQASDVEMASDVDDGGYEEDAGEGEGDTTDEELVGEDDLPNERAMRLFNLPFSVSAINPLSTMSPGISPAPRDRKPFLGSVDSPKPADILSGKFLWDSDDHDEFGEKFSRSQSLGSSSRTGPRTGHFELVKETRQVIIDGSYKVIPSPHPRFRRRGSSSATFSSVDSILQRHLMTSLQSPISESHPPVFQPLPSLLEQTGEAHSEMAAADIVDLNELLEASFLAPEPCDSLNLSTDTESPRKPAKNFNRWDIVSVGAFRHSREPDGPAGWSSDAPVSKANTDYQSMMKSSPLSAMLWPNKSAKSKNRPRKMNVVISPVILPVRDGDRTPTNVPAMNHHSHHHHHYNLPPPHNQHHNNYPHKSRKELRRERKLKRKSFGPAHHQHPHHQHHSHHHHPNSKSRSTSSVQRSNFFMSSIPPLNL